jgi:hypothetical protein
MAPRVIFEEQTTRVAAKSGCSLLRKSNDRLSIVAGAMSRSTLVAMSTEITTSDSPRLQRWPLSPPIPGWQRAAVGFVGLILIGLLITAALLDPNPAGLGTHQQMGFPPCSSILFFGLRCPACGMTTSWAHLMNGHLIQSARANTGGLLLALLAIAGGPWMLISAIKGRWWLAPPEVSWILAISGVVMFVTLVQWIWRVVG